MKKNPKVATAKDLLKFSAKNFLRFGALALFCFILIAIVRYKLPMHTGEFREGDVSLKTIYATYDFNYTADIDEEKTALLRRQAQDKVLKLYILKSDWQNKVLQGVDSFLKNIETSKDIGLLKTDLEQKIYQAGNVAQLSQLCKKLIGKLDNPVIINTQELEQLVKSANKHISIKESAGNKEEVASIDKLTALKDVGRLIPENVFENPQEKKLKPFAIEIIEKFSEANIAENAQETNLRRDIAAKEVPPRYKVYEVKKDELIVNKGQRITKDIIFKLNQIKTKDTTIEEIFSLSGMFILISIFTVFMWLYLYTYEHFIFARKRNLLFLGFVIIFEICLAKAIILSPLPSYILPVASAAMLVMILIDSPIVAVLLSLFLSFICGVIIGNNFNMAMVILLGSVFAVFATYRIRRRVSVFYAGVLVGLINAITIIAIGLINNLSYESYSHDMAWGIISGILCSIVVGGALPFFESIFKLISNITLLELSDLNNPLLKELSQKAPGTFHHSLIVGNMAESACDAIGANSLLARLGAYYHDVGKIGKPEYFSENQIKPKHEKLQPTMSSLIIINHVKDGIELARKYKLNDEIINLIKQHHGTSLTYYFYHRALEKVQDEDLLKEEGFRYPGPKPQTKEAAVVMLADSVEAASRVLGDPTPAKIKELVQRVINSKFIDRQFDECDITLKDLEAIAEVFNRVLNGIFHSRPQYPQQV